MIRTLSSARLGTPRALAIAGSFCAALSLAACGDDTDNTTPTTTTTNTPALETTQPTMEAAPPAMEAAAPAMEAAAPAMEAAPPAMAATPAVGAATALTVSDLVGGWAADLAACSTPSEVTTITLTNFSGGGLTRTVSSTNSDADGLHVVLAGTVDNAPVTETWTFTPAGTTPPLTSVSVIMGGEAPVTWVLCPAPTP